jgi:hypothetical protein
MIEGLLAALFTVLVCWSLGAAALRRWVGELPPYAFSFLSLMSGAFLLSILVFAVALVGGANRAVFAMVGVGALLVGARAIRIPLTKPLLAVFVLGAPFAVLYLVNALAPEVSPDGTSYHLGFVARYAEAGRFVHFRDSLFAALTQGFEMLFLFAFVFGKEHGFTGHSAAATVHCLFLLLAPLGFFAMVERRPQISVNAAVGASLLFLVTPVIGKTAVSAYVDIAVALAMVAVFVALENELWLLAGLLTGFAFDIKITTGLMGLYGLVVARGHRWRYVLGAVAAAAPWLLRNAVVFQNPLAPFANELFPNAFFSADKMAGLAEALRNHNSVSWWEIPGELLVQGFRLAGLFGPVMALAPLVLFCRERRLLLFAAIALAPYPLNPGARFLIPAAPALLLGLGITLGRWPVLLALVVLLHGALSWPSVVARYASPHAWRIYEYPWKAAWRRDAREGFIRQRVGDFDAGKLLDLHVPRGETVLTVPGLQRAYHRTRTLVGYESTRATQAEEAWWAARETWLDPTWTHTFAVNGIARSVTIRPIGEQVETRDSWTIAEIDAPDAEGLRVSASHGTHSAPLAIDGIAATRWASGTPFRPGMWFRLEWPSARRLDAITLRLTPDQSRLALRAEVDDGRLVDAARRDVSHRADMQREAARALVRLGVNWVLLQDGPVAGFPPHFTFVGATGTYGLYRVAVD